MPYAEGRVFHDADSHIMELPDWIEGYADPKVREKLRPLYLGRAGKLAEGAVSDASERRNDPTRAAALIDVLRRMLSTFIDAAETSRGGS